MKQYHFYIQGTNSGSFCKILICPFGTKLECFIETDFG